MQRFRGELVFKAHRRLYHSTVGLRAIKKKKKIEEEPPIAASESERRSQRESACVRDENLSTRWQGADGSATQPVRARAVVRGALKEENM